MSETSAFAPLPEPPYHAVIFASLRRGPDLGYADMARRMMALAERQPGYLGVETCRGEDGFGITVSYWQDAAAVTAWKQQAEHLLAQKLGKARWYAHYVLRVARVERHYEGPEGRPH